MDHIPQVHSSGTATARLTIPLLDSARKWEYDSRSQGFEYFRAFPTKHGYSIPKSRSVGDDNVYPNASDGGDADGLANPPLDFLQAWLYFGLLGEAFGTDEMRFDPEHFIKRDPTLQVGATITTKELNRYIWYWAASVAHGSRDWIDEHSANLDWCLELANTVVNALSAREYGEGIQGKGNVEEGWSTTTSVLFSIITLVDYLRRARIDINIYTYEVNLPVLDWNFPPLDAALSDAGWCAAEIAKMKRETDCSTRFYLSKIDRTGLGKDHGRCTAAAGCLAHQIYEPTYRTRHRPDCKGDEMCWSLGPNVEDVVRVIADGGYPLVNLAANGREVEVQPARKGDVYVTISHVWSDGLGNPHDNTIPYCQLAYIQGLVNSLYADSSSYSDPGSPVKLWLDTLCIPVAEGHSTFRRLAINRMNETFLKSDKTLALDNSLMSQSTNMDWVEMNMRIKYCPWVTRAWTLLEGRVGKELLFRFKNNAISANVVFNRSYAAKNIAAVSGMLEQRGVENVFNEPSALQLARALILLPREPVPGLEDDAAHLDTVHAARKAYDTWMPAIQAANLASGLSDVDDDMSVNIQTRVFCPVIKHSNAGTRNIRDEFWLESRADTAAQCKSHAYFEGIYLAFRGRTASKAEDEAICFAQMLGTDTSQITAIPSLKPRARYWLTLVDSYAPLRMLCQTFGLDAHSKLTECQERRIRTLLTQVGKLPLSVLLWTGPRMRSLGWKWAPMSLLDASPGSGSQATWASNERGTVQPDDSGFTVRLPALRLSKKTTPATEADLDIAISEPVHFAISVKDDGFVGPGSATFRVHLGSGSISEAWKRYKTWSALLDTGVLDRLAILTRRRASIHDPFKNRGVLLEFRERGDLKSDADITKLVHFRGVVERPLDVVEEKLPVIAVEGDWDVEGEWCVG
ncbi:uncharacterized protein BDV17DRAFT_38485 [Aspergillus undulatus]|uniref:uncharacterized protein n=1 Tax=Aspergillus undulatus TaxID=1810928 RepID=UPI003CCD402B